MRSRKPSLSRNAGDDNSQEVTQTPRFRTRCTPSGPHFLPSFLHLAIIAATA